MVVDRESQASSWLSICRHFWTVLEGPGVGSQVQSLLAAFFRHTAELWELRGKQKFSGSLSSELVDQDSTWQQAVSEGLRDTNEGRPTEEQRETFSQAKTGPRCNLLFRQPCLWLS